MGVSEGVSISTEAGLALIAVMVIATAFFVAAEFALVASNRKKIEDEASNGAIISSCLRTDKEPLLSFDRSSAWDHYHCRSTWLHSRTNYRQTHKQPFIDLFGNGLAQPLSLVVAISLVTFLTMVVGELIPKKLLLPSQTNKRMLAKPFRIYSFLAKPIIYISDGTANKLQRSLGVEPTEELDHTPSIEDLDLAIKVSGKEGTLAQRKSRFAFEVNEICI